MSSAKKLMGTTAVGGGALAIEDVFSAYLYDGTGTIQTITNGIDLAGEGGMVWTKKRNASQDHALYDTERGKYNHLSSNTSNAQVTSSTQTLTAFRVDGFRLGTSAVSNDASSYYASWTFRKAPRFFDVVTYTGDGVAGRQIAHNLGVAPGCMIVKATNTAGSWVVYHRSNTAAPQTDYLLLELSVGTSDLNTMWNDTQPTDTVFTVGTNFQVNGSGNTYVAYLFAHDPLGPSGDGSDGLIACGGYTGNGNVAPRDIELGWEPQFVLIKNTSASIGWYMSDDTRGMYPQSSGQGNNLFVLPNTSDAESYTGELFPYSRGFTLTSTATGTNANGNNYIYIAIRRGLMRQPTDASTVFNPVAYTADNTDYRIVNTGIFTDMAIIKDRDVSSTEQPAFAARMAGRGWLTSRSTVAEIIDLDGLMATASGFNGEYPWSTMSGFSVGNDATAMFNYLTDNIIAYAFKRAPGFFDVVCYVGDDTAPRTVPHNLGVVPELIIVKARNDAADWPVYHKDVATSGAYLRLNLTSGSATLNAPVVWGDKTVIIDPTASVFTIGDHQSINTLTKKYIAYLFASCPGVSKVGSYTGNGTSQTINCGFTTGARFVLIKRTNTTGDWYVWDTARGIVAGNDPHLSLNRNDVDVSTDDSVDPDSSGFIVNQDAATNINVSSASYIFYAIA